MTQDDLANVFGVGQSSVANWEADRREPKICVLVYIADFFGVSLDELILKNLRPKVDLEELGRISLKALSTFRKVEKTRELLLDITADGVISEDEKTDMQTILSNLEELEQIAQSMKLWVKKNMREDMP